MNCWGLKNPEDPAFYRKDGTPFFSTTIHEGYFTINADENEDISEILSKRDWEETESWKFRDKVWFLVSMSLVGFTVKKFYAYVIVLL